MNSKILIITINYNQTQLTIECVASVLKSTYSNFEVLLIDNGSQPDDYDKLVQVYGGHSKVRIFRIEINCGYVGGINYALKQGVTLQPDAFIIMNNDTIIDAVSVGALESGLRKHGYHAIIAGKVYEFDEPDRLQTIGSVFTDRRYLKEQFPGRYEIDKGQYDTEMEMDMIDDILWIMPAKIIDEVGFYSTDFFYGGEQADFVLRAKKAGYRIIYSPESRIWHKGGVSYHDEKGFRKPEFYSLSTAGSIIFQYKHMMSFYFYINSMKMAFKFFFRMVISKSRTERVVNRHKMKGLFKGLRTAVNLK
ncbi:MAG: glycosyltransferase family 2 protein [Candidatus Eremiobacterota bacterium]